MGELVPFRNGSGRPPLQSGGGGGTFDAMEARVKRLEADYLDLRGDVKAIRADTSEMKGRLSGIEGRIGALPTNWTMLQINAALLALVFAVGIGTVTVLKTFGVL